MSSESLSSVQLLGFPICTAEREAVLDWLMQRAANRSLTHVITLNPEMVLLDRSAGGSHPELHGADLYVADGIGISWAAKRLLGRELPRYPGIDLAADLLTRLGERRGSVFLLGGAPGVAARAAVNLTSRIAGLTIAGTQDGFFSAPGGDAEIAGRIGASGADVLLVGMGCPRQEGFIRMHRETLGVPIMIGVGGALDVFAGDKRRAPGLVRKIGMEWVWRGLSEPARIRRMAALPRFAALVLRERRTG